MLALMVQLSTIILDGGRWKRRKEKCLDVRCDKGILKSFKI
jgi:hypothetical protein